MQDNIIVARGWVRPSEVATMPTSLECVSLFSLLGLIASVGVLLGASTGTIAAVTAALM